MYLTYVIGLWRWGEVPVNMQPCNPVAPRAFVKAWQQMCHLKIPKKIPSCFSVFLFSKMHWIKLTGVWSISDPVLEGEFE